MVTVPSASFDFTSTVSMLVNPSAASSFIASSRLLPTMLGTTLATETSMVTTDPASTRVPATGLVDSTTSSGSSDLTCTLSTEKPSASRAEAASSAYMDTTSGTTLPPHSCSEYVTPAAAATTTAAHSRAISTAFALREALLGGFGGAGCAANDRWRKGELRLLARLRRRTPSSAATRA